jgi:hypothetical protein
MVMQPQTDGKPELCNPCQRYVPIGQMHKQNVGCPGALKERVADHRTMQRRRRSAQA